MQHIHTLNNTFFDIVRHVCHCGLVHKAAQDKDCIEKNSLWLGSSK